MKNMGNDIGWQDIANWLWLVVVALVGFVTRGLSARLKKTCEGYDARLQQHDQRIDELDRRQAEQQTAIPLLLDNLAEKFQRQIVELQITLTKEFAIKNDAMQQGMLSLLREIREIRNEVCGRKV
jgi:uncharacterized coiled-coil protein SlyX